MDNSSASAQQGIEVKDTTFLYEVSDEFRQSLLQGPSKDPALQGPAKYPPQPFEPNRPGEHYVLGWDFPEERTERLKRLFWAHHPATVPASPKGRSSNPPWGVIAVMFPQYARYGHRWSPDAASLDSPPSTEDQREFPAESRQDCFLICAIDCTLSPHSDTRPTQAQYEWMCRAMGGEPQWYRWLYTESIGRIRFGEWYGCPGCPTLKQPVGHPKFEGEREKVLYLGVQSQTP